MDGGLGSSQRRSMCWPCVCPRVDLRLAARAQPPAYSTQSDARSTLTGHTRPRQPSSARRPSTALRKLPLYCSIIDSSRLPPVCPPAGRDAPSSAGATAARGGLALVARERQRALQHVAGRQHAELVAQLAGAAAAVEHRDHGVELQPRVVLQPPSRLGRPVPPPKHPTFSSRNCI
jgi:hypothetical protein